MPRELLYYVGNQGCLAGKVQITMAAKFNVSEMLSLCCNSNFGLSEDDSSYDEGEEVHAN